MFFLIIKCLVGLLAVLILVGVWRTWQMEQSTNQAIFAKGDVPSPLPDGLLHGSVPGMKVSWLGKKFDSANGTGINVFDDGGTKGERYPFETSISRGSHDKNINVLAIDYNISGNPWWLRLILDELVQVSPGQYLGKLQLRIIPGYPFTLGYFELKK